MPLRIVIDVRHIKDFGIGTYIRNLVRALAAIDPESHYILASDVTELPDFAGLPGNFELASYEPRGRKFLDSIGYSWFLRSLAPNVVHMPVYDLPPFMPRPYVVTVHDLSSYLFSERPGAQEDLRLYQFRRGLLRAERVIAVSEATERDVENLLGIPRSRMRLVYSAPDPRFFSAPGDVSTDAETRRQLLERYQISYPFLLYAGRIRRHKNIPKLIEAFAIARTELEHHPVYKDLRLIIIGDEISRHPEVRRAVLQARCQHTVRFLGFVPFDTLKVFYSAAEAFVFPSLYEGFGLPPLEAMATGTPVITSNVSSLPEAVGEAAMIVNPENTFHMSKGIVEVLTDPALRQRLIDAGAAQARSFNWRRTAEQVLQVYREIAADQ